MNKKTGLDMANAVAKILELETRAKIASFSIPGQSPSDIEPSDQEIVSLYVESFGGTEAQAVERLGRFALHRTGMEVL